MTRQFVVWLVPVQPAHFSFTLLMRMHTRQIDWWKLAHEGHV